MKKIIILIIGVCFSGCTASLVSKRDDSNRSKYAPINEKNGGTVRYQAGMSIAQNSDRERCYKKMYKACKGPYRITKEYESAMNSNTMALYPGFATTSHIVYRYIDFECEE